MTQATTTDPHRHPAEGDGKNTLGLVGLILSIVGLLTCGVLSIVSLIISVIGLFKPRKGMAIAGTIISVIGLVLLGLVGAGLIAGFAGLQTAGGIVQQGMALGIIQEGIQQEVNQTGELPQDKAAVESILQANALQMPDWMGNLEVDFRYEVLNDDTYTITFPGQDEQFDTADDIKETTDVATTP